MPFPPRHRLRGITVSAAVLLLLGACAAGPLDFTACEGSPGAVNPRFAELARTHAKEVVVTQAYVLTLSNCWANEPTEGQRAACSRVIDTGELPSRDLVLALDCRGNKRVAEGDLDGAIADYSRAIRLDPYNAELYSDRGTALILKKTVKPAIEDFNQAIALRPQFMDREHDFLYSNRAAAWLAMGEYNNAIADVNSALGYERRFSSAFANRGLAWSMKGDHSRALDDFDTAIRLAPRIAMLYVLRGNARVRSGDRDQALSDYSEAIRLDSRLAVAYLRRAGLWREKGDIGRAAADQDEATRLDPRLKEPAPDSRQSNS
jgi:tetratricopeptide (TPR) repeat protein